MKEFEEKKCKGLKKAVVRKSIDFEDYKKCLLDGQEIHRTMNKNHQEPSIVQVPGGVSLMEKVTNFHVYGCEYCIIPR